VNCLVSVKTFILLLFTPGVKRADRKAGHSSTTIAEVKNAWSYTSTPSNRSSRLEAWISIGTTLPFFTHFHKSPISRWPNENMKNS
jgi:hypothetical protein